MSTINPTPLPTLSDLKLSSEPTITVSSAPLTPPLPLSEIIESLRPALSKEATIYFPASAEFASSTARWSTYRAPQPAAVVNITSEADIAATVKWANQTSTPFLALTGGHGFTRTISSLPSNSIIINLRALNDVTVSLSTGTATISAGALTSEVIAAAHAADAHVMTGVCNSVGAISPMLGGGLGNLQALYGMAVDNMISARLVTSTGEVITVSEEDHSELWWGVKGAGHNFGIVSELTVKAHKQINGGVHWSGMMAFPGTEEHLEKVVTGLGKLGLGEGKPISCTMIWAKAPPTFEPTIMIATWYGGTAEEAEEAYHPLLSLSPVMNMTGPTPYNLINAPSDFACVKNGHKRPCFANALSTFPTVPLMKDLWNEWLGLVNEDADFGASVVLTECYGWNKVDELGGEGGMATAYPWRESRAFVMACVEFENSELEERAWEFGVDFRKRLGEGKSYVNFSSGDEEMGQIFGSPERVERLRALKKKWDPTGAFSYYNPIR